MQELTLGSLFDGAGTIPYAARSVGIRPVWGSDIEPFAIAVTRKNLPEMKHYGNIVDINGGEIEPVDIICGGSPCQDLSVAGKQAGLIKGSRSNLFFEMIRVIREMREATNGKYPRWIGWENVPGALSSNRGNDFLEVVRNFGLLADKNFTPEHSLGDKMIWPKYGVIVENGWSIAYRIMDAQYWGVPQRRRRIWLVVDLDSENAGEVLFNEGGIWTTGEAPRIPIETHLSDILEINADPKYNLSVRACEGILSRAKKHNKILPDMLREALEEVVNGKDK